MESLVFTPYKLKIIINIAEFWKAK